MNVIMVYILNLIQKCVLEVRRQIEISKMPMLLISVHWKIGTVSPFRKNEPRELHIKMINVEHIEILDYYSFAFFEIR